MPSLNHPYPSAISRAFLKQARSIFENISDSESLLINYGCVSIFGTWESKFEVRLKLSATDVIHFWFEEVTLKQRFAKDLEFDELIRSRYLSLHERARCGLLYTWREHPLDALAEIIILDQFSRNLFRESPLAFAFDSLALLLAQESIRRKFDSKLDSTKKAFLYMPFMHSESAEIHEIALFLFDQPGLEDNYHFEIRHKEIIARFGRYPHRNQILGRESTAEELEFLAHPGSSF